MAGLVYIGNDGTAYAISSGSSGGTGGGGSGVTVHNELNGREATGSHPIAAITGLEAWQSNMLSSFNTHVADNGTHTTTIWKSNVEQAITDIRNFVQEVSSNTYAVRLTGSSLLVVPPYETDVPMADFGVSGGIPYETNKTLVYDANFTLGVVIGTTGAGLLVRTICISPLADIAALRQKSGELEARIAMLESSGGSTPNSHVFSYNFDTLDDISMTRGVYNVALRRVEC